MRDRDDDIIDTLSEQVGALKAENRELRALLEELQWALAQSLRQWSNYANQGRHEPDDVDLGNDNTLEDECYSRAMAALKKLQSNTHE